MRISVAVDEATWRRLRDIAELRRNGGRASVSGVIRLALEKVLTEAKSQAESSRPAGA